MNQRRCKGCNRLLAFALGENGKAIPLDLSAPVYELSRDLLGEPTARRAEGVFVSHFSTCPARDQFSSSRKEKPCTESRSAEPATARKP